MNWNEIKEKHPESWNKLREWREYIDYCETQDDLGHYITDGVHRVGVWIYFNKRDLYDFFDKQNIYISINVNMFMMFDWSIITAPDISISIQSDFDYNLRTEAEKQAFLKAFEILEDKLNENH